MNVSHSTVHPIEAPLLTDIANNAPTMRMKDFQGIPGTAGVLALRLCQFLFAAAAVYVMASTSDFVTVTAFWFFVSICSTATHCLHPRECVLADKSWVSIWMVIGMIVYLFYGRSHSSLLDAVYVPAAHVDEIYRSSTCDLA